MSRTIIAPSEGPSAVGGGDVTIRKNSGSDVGTRPRLNLIEGANVTLTVADDAGGNEVDITIASSAVGGSSDQVAIVAADVVHTTGSLTLENVTGLTFSTTASPTELWYVEMMLLMSMNSVGGTSADYRFGWTLSGAQNGYWGGHPETGVGQSGTPPFASTLAQTVIVGSLSNVVGLGLVRLFATVASGGSAGALQLTFAQAVTTAGAIPTVKGQFSWLVARKLRS